MNYWKGLLVAALFDAATITGGQFLATEPPPPARSQAIVWPPAVPLLDRQIDSLMSHLQEHPADVGAMLALARLYTDQGWAEQAIGPLARALQIDAQRRSLWVALDRAVERSGRATITDAELVRAAREFAEMVALRGHGC